VNFVEGETRLTTEFDKQLTQDESTRFQPSEVHPFYAELSCNERVTAADHWQDVRLLTFDISDSSIVYDSFVYLTKLVVFSFIDSILYSIYIV
jgi:sulfite reductase alpha subunit-like flavoprotein